MKTFKFLSVILLIVFIIATNTINAQTIWSQIGNDIDGEAADDYSGNSVSLSSDGSIVAIGAHQNDGTGSNVGHVRIYEYTGENWTQIGNDIDGEADLDFFGQSVSLSSNGSIVAIGASYNDGNGGEAGHVRIYEYSGGNWVQIGNDIDGEFAGDFSGWSVSLSSDGTIVAIGAIGNDENGTYAGHVRIYEYSGGSWVQIGSDIDGEAAYNESGNSVSLSSDGSIVAIGAHENDGNGTDAGHVRIYEYSAGNWVQMGGDIDGEAAEDRSGNSVSLSSDGSIVAIGAHKNDGNGTDSGHVKIYEYSGGNWVQIGSDIDGEVTDDRSGISVRLSSDGIIVAIGAYWNDGNGNNSGHVRVYEYSSGNWSQIGTDINGEIIGDLSGCSVRLSSDGSIVAIGAYGNDENGNMAGHVRVYDFCCTINSITETACDSNYISPSGNYTWTSSGTYIDTIPNVVGCDSIITINLTINIVDTSITQMSNVLIANASSAAYIWVDCNNSYAPLLGETNQAFTATVDGNYAVIIIQNGCTDTSFCYTITSIDIIENNSDILIYPNPTTAKINVQAVGIIGVEVMDITGKVIKNLQGFRNLEDLNIDLSKTPKGIYIVKVTTKKGVVVQKIVLE